MRFRLLLAAFLATGVVATLAQNATNSAFDLNAASLAYSESWRQIEGKRTERLANLKTQYLNALEGLTKKAMAKGDLDEVLAVKAEKDRAQTDTPTMDADLAAMPVALKNARAAYDQSALRIRTEQEQMLRGLHEKYIQTLQAQERKLTSQGNLDDALAVRAEKERVMDHIQAETSAPAASLPAAEESPTNAVTVADTNAAAPYTFYRPGTEPPVGQKNLRKMQLAATSPQNRAAGMVYTLEVGDIVSKENLQTTKDTATSWYTKSETGTIFHRPRIWITARNKSIDAGSKLAIEYFSSDIEAGTRQKDCAEIVTLPAIAQGKTVIVDAKGIGLYKYEYESNYGSGASRTKRGREFDGLIVSIYKKDGSVLIQQTSSQTLEKEASSALPPETVCPQGPVPSTPVTH